MSNSLPSENRNRLSRLRGQKILRVVRWLFQGDLDVPDSELEADGPTIFYFEDSPPLQFEPAPELQSVKILPEIKESYGETYRRHDVTSSEFWQQRIEAPIADIKIYTSNYASSDSPFEFAVEFHFTSALKAAVEYADEGDHWDSLIISSGVKDRNVQTLTV